MTRRIARCSAARDEGKQYLHDRLERSPVEGLALERGHITARHVDLLLPLGDDELAVGGGDGEATGGGLGGINRARRGTKKGSSRGQWSSA